MPTITASEIESHVDRIKRLADSIIDDTSNVSKLESEVHMLSRSLREPDVTPIHLPKLELELKTLEKQVESYTDGNSTESIMRLYLRCFKDCLGAHESLHTDIDYADIRGRFRRLCDKVHMTEYYT